MSKLSNASNVISFVVMTASYLTLCLTFLIAYLNPSMTVLVSINNYGEATIELLMLTLSAPFIWYGSKRFLSRELWGVENIHEKGRKMEP